MIIIKERQGRWLICQNGFLRKRNNL